jgi:hypothetical protein
VPKVPNVPVAHVETSLPSTPRTVFVFGGDGSGALDPRSANRIRHCGGRKRVSSVAGTGTGTGTGVAPDGNGGVVGRVTAVDAEDGLRFRR